MNDSAPDPISTDRSADGTTAPLGSHDLRPTGQPRVTEKYRHERLDEPSFFDSSQGAEASRGRGPGLRGLSELLGALSERDLAILDLIARHRFLTTRHIETFLFHDHATPASGSRSARRVLSRLERERLVERPIRRIGGLQAGSASSIWMVTSTGQRLRSLRAGDGAVGRVRPPGERFIAHYLGIADTHLALVAAHRAGLLQLLDVTIEPGSWRYFSGLGASREVLKPDLRAVTAISATAAYEDHWFIEYDRGTESIPTVLRQCRIYEAYRRTGVEQSKSGVFPLIVWIVPDDHRSLKVTRAINDAQGITAEDYRITTPEDFIQLISRGASSP